MIHSFDHIILVNYKVLFASLSLWLMSISLSAQLEHEYKPKDWVGNIRSLKECEYIAIKVGEKIEKGSKRNKNYRYNTTYLLDKKHRVTEKIDYTSGDTLHSRLIYSYDTEGKIRRKDLYIPAKNTHLFQNFIYDAKGNNTESMIYYSDSTLKERYWAAYDDKNRMIESRWFQDTTQYERNIRKYDEKGNLVEWHDYMGENNQDTIPNYIEKYRYDEKGNQIESWVEGPWHFHDKFFYNDKGQKTEIKFYDEYEACYRVKSYSYDKTGNLISEITTEGDKVVEEMRYKFDKRKNWIQLICVKKDIPAYILERKIKYY